MQIGDAHISLLAHPLQEQAYEQIAANSLN
jgi:hypothetical protein